MDNNWNVLIIPVYFFYGLAFYSMGFALLLESGRASELGCARSMRLLVGIGLLHGISNYLKSALILYDNISHLLWFQWLQIALPVASFLALLAFGEHLRSLESELNKGTCAKLHLPNSIREVNVDDD